MKVGDLIMLTARHGPRTRVGLLGVVIRHNVPAPHQKPFVYIFCSSGEIRRAREDACEVINESW